MGPAAPEAAPVYVVDADPQARARLTRALTAAGFAAQGFASTAALLARADALAAGCVVADLETADGSGPGLQAELARAGADLPVVVVSAVADVAAAVRAMKAGAADVLVRPVPDRTLAEAVAGALAWHARRRASDGAGEAARTRIATLTRRERDVLGGIVHGAANKAIAQCLGISPRTVEVHRANLMAKLGCRNLSEIVRLAVSAGFAPP